MDNCAIFTTVNYAKFARVLRSILLAVIVILVSVFAGIPAAAGDAGKGKTDPGTLKTKQDRLSYAIGVNVATMLQQQGVPFEKEIAFRAMQDVFDGADLLMSNEEIRQELSYFYAEAKRKRMAKLNEIALEHKNSGIAFLESNKKQDGVKVLPSGLQYKVIKQGDGKKPSDGSAVEVRFRGTLVNGVEFDSSERTGGTAELKVGDLISGWREALKLMPAGSIWQIVIPPDLAYGAKGNGSTIRPDSVLIYEVELLAVK